jgi:Flp pilus assembly protein TadD
MNWIKRIFRSGTGEVNYYEEGVELLRVGKYHEAVTSFRLALRDAPDDSATLQQMAIAYTRIGMTDEAAKTYRQVLRMDPASPGAHYGLAFLLLRDGKEDAAVPHLRAFLASPPPREEAGPHLAHARETLARLIRERSAGEEPR